MSSVTGIQRGETIVYPIEAPADASLRTINSYLIVHADGLFLIDAGLNNDACWNAFMQVMRKLDYAIEEISGVILTHHHPDHVGTVHRIRKHNKSVKVYAHPLAIPYVTQDQTFLSRRIAFLDRLYREMDGMPEAADQIEKFKSSLVQNKAFRMDGDIERLQEGDRLLDFSILDAPGHAPDHILLYDPNRKWAFVGDLVIEHMSTNAIVEPDAEGRLIPVVTQQLASLKRCLDLDANLLFTGHGQVIREPKTVIEEKIARISHKQERMINWIREGYVTAGSMARLYDKETFRKQFFLVMSEVVGVLDHLERTGRVAKHLSEGIYHFELTGRSSSDAI
jgi:Zn-dependent hydrolases, including glyoxylases